MRSMFLVLLTLLVTTSAHGAEDGKANLVAVGQGVSSPSSTSTINYSSGYTPENPVGTIYQNGLRLTGQYDKNGSSAVGVEVGYGKGEWGVAIGHRERECDNCEGSTAAAIGIVAADIGLGLRIEDGAYTAGFLLNPRGEHRIGLTVGLNDAGDEGSDTTAFGVGYSYVTSNITLTIDGSQRSSERDPNGNNRLVVTPGIVVRADVLQLSVSDRISFNENNNNNESNEDHSIWVGIGFGGDDWHFVGYIDYVNEIALVGSLYF